MAIANRRICDSRRNPNPDAYGDTHSHAYCNPNCDTHTYGNSYSDAYAWTDHAYGTPADTARSDTGHPKMESGRWWDHERPAEQRHRPDDTRRR